MNARIKKIIPELYHSTALFLLRRKGSGTMMELDSIIAWFYWIKSASKISKTEDIPVGWILEREGVVVGVSIATPFRFHLDGNSAVVLVGSSFFVDPAYKGFPAFTLFKTFCRYHGEIHIAATTANALSGGLWEAVRGERVPDADLEYFQLGQKGVALIEEVLTRRFPRLMGSIVHLLPSVDSKKVLYNRLVQVVKNNSSINEVSLTKFSQPESFLNSGKGFSIEFTENLVVWICSNPLAPAMVARVESEWGEFFCLLRTGFRGCRQQLTHVSILTMWGQGYESEREKSIGRVAKLLKSVANLCVIGFWDPAVDREKLKGFGFHERRRPECPRWWLAPKGEKPPLSQLFWTGVEAL